MARQSTTAKVFGESSKSRAENFKHARGLGAEERVKLHFEGLGYRVRATRWRTPYAELDLVLVGPTGRFLLLEVKAVLSEARWDQPVSAGQRRRLRRAWSWFIERFGSAEFQLVCVDDRARIEIIADFLET